MFDEIRPLSPEVLAQLQAEGLEPVPADWLDRRRWRSRTSAELDMLDDPVKAARHYKMMVEQERERERRHRYVRGLPPLPEDAEAKERELSVPQPRQQAGGGASGAESDASAVKVSLTELDRSKVRVRTRTRPGAAHCPAPGERSGGDVMQPSTPTPVRGPLERSVSSDTSSPDAADTSGPNGPDTVRRRRPRVESQGSCPTELVQGGVPNGPREPKRAKKNAGGSCPATDPERPADPPQPEPEALGEPSNYKVGPGKPPLETRFKPGKSGNPNGRPKGAKNAKTVALDILNRKIPAVVHGKKMMLSGFAAMFEKQFAKALEKGDRGSAIFMLEQAGLLPGQEQDGVPGGRASVAPEPLSPGQVDILRSHQRDLLLAAGVDPAKIESLLSGADGEDHDQHETEAEASARRRGGDTSEGRG